jgi:hypothetical protein
VAVFLVPGVIQALGTVSPGKKILALWLVILRSTFVYQAPYIFALFIFPQTSTV